MLGWLKKTKLHFIGIGGIGMSGIAEVLLDLGYEVSGSDLSESKVTEHLISKGAAIYKGHAAHQVEGSTLIIYSSAIDFKNPEVIRAQELHIPMIRRAEMLAELMRLKFGIAVAGSHGKTTTTSLIATIFEAANLDATHIIGGIVQNLGGNARKGDGQYLIAEADESDGSFLLLKPIMTTVTNIDDDHLDHYGSREKIVDAFIEFVNSVPFYGRVVMNASDAPSLAIKSKIKRPLIWYGIETEKADYEARQIQYSAEGTQFELYYQKKFLRVIQTPLIGRHNVLNAMAAISICREVEIDLEIIQKGLLNFLGVGRRLEKLFTKDQFIVIDDYGHHPTEIMATISALKKVDKRPLVVIFEPHRFTRTQNFWKEFQTSFEGADEVYLTPIYAASEKPIDGITSEQMAKEMGCMCLTSLEGMREILERKKDSPCIFLTLGAGAISKKIREMVATL
jgi:UDP-N-acetylmuramate--alanine ligase